MLKLLLLALILTSSFASLFAASPMSGCFPSFEKFLTPKLETPDAVIAKIENWYTDYNKFEAQMGAVLKADDGSNYPSLLLANKKLIQSLHDIFKDMGVDLPIKKITVDCNKAGMREADVIQIPTNISYKLEYVELLRKFSRSASINGLYIDFFTNAHLHANGFFDPSVSEVHLGIKTIGSIFNLLGVGRTAWHEMAHAHFFKMLKSEERSIYHIRWRNLNKAGALPIPVAGYNQYLSAEELYTFTNGPYWELKLPFFKLDTKGKKHVIETLEYDLAALPEVSASVSSMSKVTLQILDALDKKGWGITASKNWGYDAKSKNLMIILPNQMLISFSSKVAEAHFAELLKKGNEITLQEADQFGKILSNEMRERMLLLFTTSEAYKKEYGSIIQTFNAFKELLTKHELLPKLSEAELQKEQQLFMELKQKVTTLAHLSRERAPEYRELHQLKR